jgi:hypothetical protein
MSTRPTICNSEFASLDDPLVSGMLQFEAQTASSFFMGNYSVLMIAA